jgi:hypothetical protein
MIRVGEEVGLATIGRIVIAIGVMLSARVDRTGSSRLDTPFRIDVCDERRGLGRVLVARIQQVGGRVGICVSTRRVERDARSGRGNRDDEEPEGAIHVGTTFQRWAR